MTAAQKTLRTLAACTLLAALALAPAGALASSSGGTASPGGGTPTAPRAQAKPSTSKHRRAVSVRITSVACVPPARCDGFPHHAPFLGPLTIAPIGFHSGMIIPFPPIS